MKIIHASGSFEEIGSAVGETMRAEIGEVCDAVRRQVERVADYEKIARRYARITRDACPDAYTYLRGLARAARVTRESAYLASFAEEILAWTGLYVEKCSTLVVPVGYAWAVGHGEDFDRCHLGRMCLIDMRPAGRPRTVSVNYCVQVPCLAGVVSERGFCITNNSMPGASKIGSPVAVRIMRAAQAESFGEALGILSSDDPVSLPTHFTLLGKDGQASSIEIAPEDGGRTKVSIEGLTSAYCHTNHALRLVAETEAGSPNSIERLRRLQAAVAEADGSYMPVLLPALTSRDGIVCKTPEDVVEGDSVTLATVIMRPAAPDILVMEHGASSESVHIAL